MKTLKETKILGFPLWMFLILAALMMVMAANDWMLTNMVGALALRYGRRHPAAGLGGRSHPRLEDLVRRRHALRLPCGRCFQYASISSVRAPRKP